jgi:hypothetical protein
MLSKDTDFLLAYQIFDWRITMNENENGLNEFILRKRYKHSSIKKSLLACSKVVLIVAPSNYKLIHDLFVLKDIYKFTLVFYTWDSWGSRNKVKFKYQDIYTEFLRYIQRGYLTSLLYQKLSFFNIQRIEQFISFLAIQAAQEGSFNKFDITGSINTNDAISSLISQGYSLRKCVDKLIYHSRKNDITDPFMGSFSFISNTNSLFKKLSTGINSSHKIIDSINRLSMFPYTDVLKTLRFMEKNDLIDSISCSVDQSVVLTDDYNQYLSQDIWAKAYKLKTYQFSGLFPPIDVPTDQYACPLCGSTSLRETPQHFYCSDVLCKLFIYRIIKPCGVKKQISEIELIRLLKHGSAVIKNKKGGYSRFMIYRKDDVIKIIPQIEHNISEE